MMEYSKEKAQESLFSRVCEALPDAARKDPRQISPLVLAYVGDTIYDLFVRTQLVCQSDQAVRGLHLLSASKVCAQAQAQAAYAVMDELSEDELSIYKRGRNAHMGTVPKHAQISDYRAATGLEALLGYLYLSGQDERLLSLFSKILKGEPSCPKQD